jgi:hypothetical protein
VKELIKNNSNGIGQSGSIISNIIPNPPKEILNLILLTIIPSNNQQPSDLITVEGKQTSNKSLILSKLISRFSRFTPYLKNLIKTYEENIKQIVNAIKLSTTTLSKIKATFKNYVQLKDSLVIMMKMVFLVIILKNIMIL